MGQSRHKNPLSYLGLCSQLLCLATLGILPLVVIAIVVGMNDYQSALSAFDLSVFLALHMIVTVSVTWLIWRNLKDSLIRAVPLRVAEHAKNTESVARCLPPGSFISRSGHFVMRSKER